VIGHSLSNTKTATAGATATSKAKMTKGHIAPLDADEGQSFETYCFSFLSLLYQDFDVGDLSFPPPSSFSSKLALDPRPRPISRSPGLRSRNFRDPLLVNPLSRVMSSDIQTTLGPRSHEPVKRMSPFQRKRTREQPEDTTTLPGRGEEHHS
jgi:hypothetical protein